MLPLWISVLAALLSWRPVSCLAADSHQEPETPDWRMTLKTIRNGVHRIDMYLNAALELFGGEDGLCHYKCMDGKSEQDSRPMEKKVKGADDNVTETDSFVQLTELNFDVRAYDNLKVEDMWNKIMDAAAEDHSDADCFLCVFLSHGENDHVYAYDAKVKIQDLTAQFKGDKCKSLVGKPKIFIIQACRGDKHDEPVVPMDSVDSQVNEVVADAGAVYTLPAGADFIMCYSVAEGYYSHRETVRGSWYIQDLCAALTKFGPTLEFTEILTLVNRKVAARRVDRCADRSSLGKKQVPCFASMLTKKMYFRPKSS
ncbi:caspase-6-like isoform X2 [Polypterus senegalus]|uniref:caspase-6-like isoform X2 n=1 Tax=Polypterus senegalus TaxID=55291 RepID=UPI001964E4E3|nr:caspase-6-like isoform X2 [Polypterus senegalus]